MTGVHNFWCKRWGAGCHMSPMPHGQGSGHWAAAAGAEGSAGAREEALVSSSAASSVVSHPALLSPRSPLDAVTPSQRRQRDALG